MGGCTSSEEETENREEREEMHVASGWRVFAAQRYTKGMGSVGEDGTQRKGRGYLILFAQVIIQGRYSQDPASQVGTGHTSRHSARTCPNTEAEEDARKSNHMSRTRRLADLAPYQSGCHLVQCRSDEVELSTYWSRKAMVMGWKGRRQRIGI
jgi:hypothetical protein